MNQTEVFLELEDLSTIDPDNYQYGINGSIIVLCVKFPIFPNQSETCCTCSLLLSTTSFSYNRCFSWGIIVLVQGRNFFTPIQQIRLVWVHSWIILGCGYFPFEGFVWILLSLFQQAKPSRTETKLIFHTYCSEYLFSSKDFRLLGLKCAPYVKC